MLHHLVLDCGLCEPPERCGPLRSRSGRGHPGPDLDGAAVHLGDKAQDGPRGAHAFRDHLRVPRVSMGCVLSLLSAVRSAGRGQSALGGMTPRTLVPWSRAGKCPVDWFSGMFVAFRPLRASLLRLPSGLRSNGCSRFVSRVFLSQFALGALFRNEKGSERGHRPNHQSVLPFLLWSLHDRAQSPRQRILTVRKTLQHLQYVFWFSWIVGYCCLGSSLPSSFSLFLTRSVFVVDAPCTGCAAS